MLFYFYKNQSKPGTVEALYWRCYLSIYLVSFLVLLPSVGAIESLLLAWVLVDVIGGALFFLFAFGFIVSSLSARLKEKLGQKA